MIEGTRGIEKCVISRKSGCKLLPSFDQHDIDINQPMITVIYYWGGGISGTSSRNTESTIFGIELFNPTICTMIE